MDSRHPKGQYKNKKKKTLLTPTFFGCLAVREFTESRTELLRDVSAVSKPFLRKTRALEAKFSRSGVSARRISEM